MLSKLIFVLFLTLTFVVSGQYDSDGPNTSRFRPGFFWYFTGFRPAVPERVRKYDRLIFDVVYSDWHGDLKPMKNNWASLGLNSNLMFDIPLVKKNLISLGIGACYGYSTIRHNNDVFTNQKSNWTYIVDSIPVSNLIKSSFVGHNFSIPIEIRFRTKGWKHFKAHVGGKIGYQTGFKGKSKSQVLDGIAKTSYSIPDYSRLTYSAHIRLGIRNWALFASYNFNPMFTNSKSSQLNMLQFGLSVSVF